MTTEERLVEALQQVDSYRPSPDLYARLERSIEEDRRHRRRILGWAAGVAAFAALVTAWVAISVREGPAGDPTIEGWRLALAYLAVVAGVVVGLGPHLRRFGEGFLEGVFWLHPPTGRTFVRVLDVAYYAAFTGLALADADQWRLDQAIDLWGGLENRLDNLGLVLLVMGVLHTVNVLGLPILGLVFNSIVRRDSRRRAGDSAPPESPRARLIDNKVQTIAIVLVVLALAFAFTLLVGGPASQLFSQLF